MSNELALGAAVVAGIALGMNETVRKGVAKAGGVTKAALTAGRDRFSQTEPSHVEVSTVTRLPERREA